MKNLFAKPKSGQTDTVFVGILVFLLVFGAAMLMNASSELAKMKFDDSTYYLVHQMLNGFLPGLVGFAVGWFTYYRVWEKIAPWIMLGGLLLLALPFTPLGLAAKGGARWVNLGAFSFQPGEIMKLAFFVYLAAWMGKSQQRAKSFAQGMLPFTILVGSVMGLLLLQPATSMAGLIFLTSVLVYFSSGARVKFVAALVLVGAVGIIGLVTMRSGGYRMDRVQTFMEKNADPQGKGYQVAQAELAIGSGGLFGVGFGQSSAKRYLPEPMGDSIFAIVAEELGFVGAIGLLFAYLALIWRGLRIARDARDDFGRYLVTSFMVLFGLQTFVNVGAISGVIPMTGVPLPFVSYGGTALAVMMTMCGIVANVAKYGKTA